MTEKHFGMVVEEDGQLLIAFKPETIQFITSELSMKDGDVVLIDSIEGDKDQKAILIQKLDQTKKEMELLDE